MHGTDFDEIGFFREIHKSGARALLIGRRALILLGLPVLTADYDFWVAIDDIARFNEAGAPFGLAPTRSVDEARRAGRYRFRTTSRSTFSSPGRCRRSMAWSSNLIDSGSPAGP